MISDTKGLNKLIYSVYETMKEARTELKNAILLENLTDLRTIMQNATRSSGKFPMVNGFVRIRN